MGKGSGGCERIPLHVGASEDGDTTGLNDGQSTAFDAWLEETDVKKLTAALHTAASPSERMAILHRIRDLRAGKKSPTSMNFETQTFDAALLQTVKHYPRELKALFCDDSVFKDGLLYLEYFPKPATTVSSEKKWTYGYLNANKKQWKEYLQETFPQYVSELTAYSFTKLFKRKIRLHDQQTVQPDDVNAHFTHFAKETWTDCTTDSQEAMVAWLLNAGWSTKEIASKTKIEPEGHRLYADIQPKMEEQIIASLVEAGAHVVDNDFEVAHDSWAVDPGKRFKLTLADGSIVYYVPHFSVGQQKIMRHEHHGVLNPLSEEEAISLKEAIAGEYRKHILGPANLLLSGKEYRKEDDFKDHGQVSLVTSTAPNMVKNPKIWRGAQAACASGEPIVRGKGKSWEHKLRFWEATPERMEEYAADYQTQQANFDNGGTKYLTLVTDPHLLAVLEAEGEDTTQPLYMYNRTYHRYVRALENVDGLIEAEPLKVSWVDDNEHVDVSAQASHIRSLLSTESNKHAIHLGRAGLRFRRLQSMQWETTDKVAYETVPHTAPKSERGVLKMETEHPLDGPKRLQELGFLSGLSAEVPYEAFYADNLRDRMGRILLDHDQFVIGEKLQLPATAAVIHSMTGCGAEAEYISRFENIHRVGGLRSIAERRRMTIGVSSMSPQGDIQSGVDMGLFTTMTTSPNSLSFVMKPTALHRRDIWFAAHDYGGGGNRFDQYDQYAQSLGQKGIYSPPNKKSRQKHIDAVPQGGEICFKHELRWCDIDSILVEGGLYNEVLKRVKKWKAEGTMPEHVRVLKTHETKDRIIQMNKEYHGK